MTIEAQRSWDEITTISFTGRGGPVLSDLLAALLRKAGADVQRGETTLVVTFGRGDADWLEVRDRLRAMLKEEEVKS